MNKNKKREKLIGDINLILLMNKNKKKRESDKRYRDNMSDERKQKLRYYQIDYQKKILCSKKAK